MSMPLANKSLRIVLQPTAKDNAQDAFKDLQLKKANVSRRFVTSLYVWLSMQTKLNASLVLRDRTWKMDVVMK